jgi:streptogramin lyase
MTRIEDRLRQHYRDEVAGLEVPDLLPTVLAAGRRARRRSRLLSTAGIAGVVTAAVVASVMFPRLTISQRAAHQPVSRPFTVITRTDLSGWGPVSGMAAVPGGVWLASWMQGELLRIDAETGQITVRLPVGRPQDGPSAIAYGAGSLWVTNFQTSDLLRLDPTTGQVLATVHLPTQIGDVAIGDGFVWVSQWGHVAGSWYRLAKVNPLTDRVLALQGIQGNFGPGGLTIAASTAGVWVNADGGPSLQVVDPASLRLLGSTRIGTAVNGLAATSQRVWALIGGTLSRIDPPWSAVAHRLQLYPITTTGPTQNLGDQTLAAGPAHTLWAAGPVLYRINEMTMRAKKVNGFGPVDNVSVIGQTLWVQTDDKFVYQLALNRASSSPAVPDVVLATVSAAKRLLTRDGYAVKVIRRVGLEPLGRVIFETPAAGSLMPPRTTVILVISAGPARSPTTP